MSTPLRAPPLCNTVVGGIAWPALRADWPTGLVEHDTDHHLTQVGPMVFGDAVLTEAFATAAGEHQGGGVEQHDREVGGHRQLVVD